MRTPAPVASASRANRSRYVILGILCIQPSSGYDIRKAIAGSTAHFWSESPGQIYPALQQMVRDREITRKEQARGGRERTVYSITAAGRRAFDAWIRQPYQPTVERNEMLLKLFFGRLAPPEVTRAHLAQAREEAHAYVGTMQAILTHLEEDLPAAAERIHVEATVRLGLRVAQAHLEWCDDINARMDSLWSRGARRGAGLK